MFDAEEARLDEEYDQRMKEYGDPKTKSAKGAKNKGPPRKGRMKLVQLYLCPCWKLGGKSCPSCKGNGPKMQDPDGRPGEMIPRCSVCRCPCALGKFKDSERADLAAAFLDYQSKQTSDPTVSPSRDPGIGNVQEMCSIAIEVSWFGTLLTYYVLFMLFDIPL